MKTSRKDNKEKEVAKERIIRLLGLAGKVFKDHPERSHRYVELARKIAMRHRIRMTNEQKILFCSQCYKYILPKLKHKEITGKDCTICNNCKKGTFQNKAK